METDEQTDGCWLTGVKGPCRAFEETQGPPWGLAEKGARTTWVWRHPNKRRRWEPEMQIRQNLWRNRWRHQAERLDIIVGGDFFPEFPGRNQRHGCLLINPLFALQWLCFLALPEASLAAETPLTLEALSATLHGDVANCDCSLENHTAIISQCVYLSMNFNFCLSPFICFMMVKFYS